MPVATFMISTSIIVVMRIPPKKVMRIPPKKGTAHNICHAQKREGKF